MDMRNRARPGNDSVSSDAVQAVPLNHFINPHLFHRTSLADLPQGRGDSDQFFSLEPSTSPSSGESLQFLKCSPFGCGYLLINLTSDSLFYPRAKTLGKSS